MMTSDQPLPMSPKVALDDVTWFADHPPGDLGEQAELLLAARTLALVIRRANALKASSIGADQTLRQNRYDTMSFYAGVAFGLSRVSETLNSSEGER
jgi:hypothetical protein